MTFHRHVFQKLALTSCLVSLPLAMASAQDVNVVAERFKQVMATQNIEVSWTSVTSGPSSMVLEGVKIGPVGAGKPAEVGKLTFEGITEEDGSYAVETIKTDPFSKTEDGITLDVASISMTGVRLAAEGSEDANSMVFYDGLDVPSLTVKQGDKTAFSMENLAFEITPPEEGQASEFSGGAEKFTADLTLASDPQSKAVIDALGYQTINGDFAVAGTWNPSDGKMEMSQYDITVENAGTFGITTAIGGYTADFIKSLQQLQKQMAATPEGADNSAQGMAILGLMQQLTFQSASIRWDDDSLTGKVLDYVAKQQNMKVDDIKNQAKAMTPFLTAQLNNPELSTQITTAVTAYLDNPQSLEISAVPASPVPFAQIAAGAQNPMELPKLLGVTVKANEEQAQ